ncbi:MAG: hypothetical protein AB7P03_23045 [Kofleriaceae bacterium]
MHRILLLMIAFGCGGSGRGTDVRVDAPTSSEPPADAAAMAPDADLPFDCSAEVVAKIKFDITTGCQNDGSVEFCAPEHDTAVMALLKAIEPNLVCGPWGGRAMCRQTPGTLLCMYQTEQPVQCTATDAMKPAVWADMCRIAGLPQITEIVHTFLE